MNRFAKRKIDRIYTLFGTLSEIEAVMSDFLVDVLVDFKAIFHAKNHIKTKKQSHF